MAEAWGDFLSNTAQNFIGTRTADLARQPATQVAVSPAGVPYAEGKPVTVSPLNKLAGINPIHLGLGVLALGVVGYLALRK